MRACTCVRACVRSGNIWVRVIGEGETECLRLCLHLSVLTSLCMCAELQLGRLNKWLRVVDCQSRFISKPTLRQTPGKWEQEGLLANLVRERAGSNTEFLMQGMLKKKEKKERKLISDCNHRNASLYAFLQCVSVDERKDEKVTKGVCVCVYVWSLRSRLTSLSDS